MNKKEAFKLGFVIELARNGTGPRDLCKEAALTGLAGPLAGGALGLGYASGVSAPSFTGSLVGRRAAGLTELESDSVRMAKKRFLVDKLEDMIKAEKIRRSNEFLSRMIKEDRDAQRRP